jgi:hypothetical protein
LYLSAIRARPILLDMLPHLAFLVGSLYLATFFSSLVMAMVAGVVIVAANIGWSIAMTPALRNLAGVLWLQVKVKLKLDPETSA